MTREEFKKAEDIIFNIEHNANVIKLWEEKNYENCGAMFQIIPKEMFENFRVNCIQTITQEMEDLEEELRNI